VEPSLLLTSALGERLFHGAAAGADQEIDVSDLVAVPTSDFADARLAGRKP